MYIQKIDIKNYRAHAELSVEFKAYFNVITGLNGCGKTSILNAVAELLSGLYWQKRQSKQSILLLDSQNIAYSQTININNLYRFEPQYPVEITARGNILDNDFEWIAQIEHSTALLNLLDKTASQSPQENIPINDQQTLPIVAFYQANRDWHLPEGSVLEAASEKLSRFSAYEQWRKAAFDFKSLQSWVIAKCLERLQISSETGKRFDDIQDDELAFVNHALNQAFNDMKGLKYDLHQKALLLEWIDTAEKPHQSSDFNQLSDGQKAVIGLITDIARRMCILNPHLGNEVTSNTPGIILIDELETHLHPEWQRLLVNGLKSAFPKIQFITTSHSPQILSELKPEEIILLESTSAKPPEVSYGLDVNQILLKLMGASPRAKHVQEQLDELYGLIEISELEAAKQRLTELKKEMPGLPELSAAAALILRKEVIGR